MIIASICWLCGCSSTIFRTIYRTHHSLHGCLCPVSLGLWGEANESVNGSHFLSSIVRALLSACTGRIKLV